MSDFLCPGCSGFGWFYLGVFVGAMLQGLWITFWTARLERKRLARPAPDGESQQREGRGG